MSNYLKSQEMQLSLTVDATPEILSESTGFKLKMEADTADFDVNNHVTKNIDTVTLMKKVTTGITGQVFDTDNNVIAELARKLYQNGVSTKTDGIPFELTVTSWKVKLAGTCSIKLTYGDAANGEPAVVEFDITFQNTTASAIV